MMVDLGKYAGTVLSAYGVSLVLIGGIVALSLWRARRMKAQLRAVEERVKHGL
ncbi:heme exporter protein CcmD [Pseudooceanicola sp. HF7]|uniref:heme exporter protein CcmD n=1 Tax=Pseudooceanicola sp. HF7 TaxID=2721560 RepID=UPI00142F3EDD|nr:heme exporter protein CcmD [Pseudooceanicola sp. HF7]NIZ09846.1 heme exporter protein CcmD [Pseudooceanicola sp. HF7]